VNARDKRCDVLINCAGAIARPMPRLPPVTTTTLP
jgi:hypothetical protein